MSENQHICELCGEPMPEGEEMFKYHGYSGPCPKQPLPETAKSVWITNHNEVSHHQRYIVFSIGTREDKTTYLCSPQLLLGWQFKRLMPKCYAAIPMPEWRGLL